MLIAVGISGLFTASNKLQGKFGTDIQPKDTLEHSLDYYRDLCNKDPDNMYYLYGSDLDSLGSYPDSIQHRDSIIYDSIEKDFFERNNSPSDSFENEEGW